MRGVAIYIKDDIKCDEVTIKNDYNDQLWVRIKLRGNDSLLCGCLYRSPTNDQARLKETTDKICGIIEEAVSQKDTHLLICGDFMYRKTNPCTSCMNMIGHPENGNFTLCERLQFRL